MREHWRVPLATRRMIAGVVALVVILGIVSVAISLWESGEEVSSEATGSQPDASTDDAEDEVGESAVGEGAAPSTEAPTTTTTTAPPRPPADATQLVKFTTIGGEISPKSVVASGDGTVTAQNMMYRHTVTAYDRDGNLLATIPDSVRLSEYGIAKEGEYQGAPVEAAFLNSGSHVYVSNYSMYGPGFREGTDSCSPASGIPESYLYRIDTATWGIDQVIPAGAVPKYVAVTPDDRYVLATNWCTYDLTVADVETGQEVRRIPIGRYPRGIAISPDGRTVYIAVMGGTEIATVDLQTWAVGSIGGVGASPRHVVLSPDGRYLFVTLNGEGNVAKVDVQTGQVVAKVSTGRQPRTMAISEDGTALYVVNYGSDTMSKLSAADLSELQAVPTGSKPIGVTYDPATGRVWVANYSGSIYVFDEQ